MSMDDVQVGDQFNLRGEAVARVFTVLKFVTPHSIRLQDTRTFLGEPQTHTVSIGFIRTQMIPLVRGVLPYSHRS